MSAQIIFREHKHLFAQGKSQFSAAHPYLATLCLTERVKPRDCVLCVPLNIADKNRAPKNRNARSGVRFLGKRSNKRIYAMRQILCAACTSSPCCDARSGFPSDHENSQASARREFCEKLLMSVFQLRAHVREFYARICEQYEGVIK